MFHDGPGFRAPQLSGPPKPSIISPIHRHPGTVLWEELHGMIDPSPETLVQWELRIHQEGAKRQWAVWKEKNPPVFGAGWLEWTVAARNAINRQIGKPSITLAEAQKFRDQKLSLPPAQARSGPPPRC